MIDELPLKLLIHRAEVNGSNDNRGRAEVIVELITIATAMAFKATLTDPVFTQSGCTCVVSYH
jgi:hypothetical protein